MSNIYVPQTGQTIAFRENLRTQDFSFSGNTFTVRRTFQCRWQDRFQLSMGMMGGAKIPDASRGTLYPSITRYAPIGFAAHTDLRPTGSKPILYNTGVESMEGVGPTPYVSSGIIPNVPNIGFGRFADPNLYVYANVKFLNEAPTYSVLEDANCPLVNLRLKSIPETFLKNPTLSTYPGRFEARRWVTRITQPLTEAIRVPVNYWSYVEGFWQNGASLVGPNGKVDIGTFIINPSLEVTYVLHQVPALVQPWETGVEWLYQDRPGTPTIGSRPELLGAVYTHLGCVNARWFDGFPPGTLLLTAIEARPYRWITGERFYDYTYRMKYWNPTESFPPGSFPYIATTGSPPVPIPTRTSDGPYSYAGHNYLLRLKAVKKTGSVLNSTLPYYSLVTNDGSALESATPGTGMPIFQYRDFEDLFIPYNRAHMVAYYKKVQLCPGWDEAGT